ncbi:hypothetical protein BJX62DRAFT_245320 [Aspergillus germanicus]
MNTLSRVFNYLVSFTRKPSFDEEGDDCYPIQFIDQAGIIKDSIITYTFRYNSVLDPEKLHGALVRLLGEGDWRKLGGRLRRNKSGQLVIHVPRQPHRKVRFSHVAYQPPISAHHLGSLLPKQTGVLPSIQKGCHTFRAFSVPPDLPNDIQHYLTSDEPLLSLRIVSFEDATLVSVTFPHAVADAMGTASLLRAWSCMLAEAPDNQIPPPLAAREDIMASVGTPDDRDAQPQYTLEHRRLRGLPLLRLILRITWDHLTRRNIHARTIYLPARFVAELRRQSQSQCQSLDSYEDGKLGHSDFISNGDLITAWGARMVILSRAPHKPAVIFNVFDLRSRLPGLLDPAGVYLQNLILPSTVPLPEAVGAGQDQLTRSVGWIARRIRHAIVEQTTEPQIRRLMRVTRASVAHTGMMPLFSGPDATFIACTNWSRARFREAANFSPAVLSSPGPDASHGGACVAFWGTTMGTSDAPRDTFVVYGKDEEGNYWLHGYLRQETWDYIQREFEEWRIGSR